MQCWRGENGGRELGLNAFVFAGCCRRLVSMNRDTF